jgi:hypothetical protein
MIQVDKGSDEMRDTSHELVTIAVTQGSVEANVVKNYLAEAGIEAFLVDDEAVSMNWVMTNAYGGMKVQVAAVDADVAREALELKSEAGEHGEVWTSVSPSASLERMPVDDEPEKEPSVRETNANRAFRAAVLGLLFWPIELYAVYVLFKVYRSSEILVGRPRTLAKLASVITGAAILSPVLALWLFVRGPITPEVDLRELPHPEVLVATWEGKFMRADAEVRVSMQLRQNGNIHYRETGPAPVDCDGTWAYKNRVFLVRYDRYLKGASSSKGKVMQPEIQDFRTTEMSMRLGDEWVRMVRTK